MYLLRISERKRNPEDNIIEAKVLSVGRKYLTVMHLGEIKFDMKKDFRQVTVYAPEYRLYLTKEEVLKEIDRDKKRKEITQECSWRGNVVEKMTDEELETIYKIVRKYKSGSR